MSGWSYEPQFAARSEERIYSSDLGSIAREGRNARQGLASFSVEMRRPFGPYLIKFALPLTLILLVALLALLLPPERLDVRSAMGNPAALRTTTEVKWENFLAEFNSRLVLLAARYPGLVHPDGAVVNEKEVFDGLAQPFGALALEEQIDLAGYLIRNGAMGGASEEETMNAFAWFGYLGGTAGAAFMVSSSLAPPIAPLRMR